MKRLKARPIEADVPETPDPVSPPAAAPKPTKAQERNLSLGVLSAKLKKNYTFFANLSEEEMVAFLRMCDRQNYKSGAVIFEEGEREEYWYFVLAGRVAVYRKEKVLGHVGEGQCFGEVGLLKKDAPRSASARAAAETILLAVPHDILSQKMPALAYKVLEYIANQLAEKLLKADSQLESQRAEAPAQEGGKSPEEETPDKQTS
ncbi:MAG: cyclic nucleotide-binding domain-containing protein [Candidatus Tectomicrobia bacterium]|nr:cyclic nucleotide-binding domain-containing protein [Candidatus Tectomicrobia bacterium]